MAEMPGIPDALAVPPALPPQAFPAGVPQDPSGAALAHAQSPGEEQAPQHQEPSRVPGEDLVSPKKRAKPAPKSVEKKAAPPGASAPPPKKSHKAMVRPPGEGGWGPGGQLHLPLQRVKNMMKANERVAIVTTEAALLTTKATETFIAWVTKEGFNRKDAKEKKRGLLYEDLADAVDNNPMQLEFCKDLIPHKRPKWEHLGIDPPKSSQKKPSRPSLPRKATQPKPLRSSSPARSASPQVSQRLEPGTRIVGRGGRQGASPASQGAGAKDEDDDEEDDDEMEEDEADLVSGLVEASGHRQTEICGQNGGPLGTISGVGPLGTISGVGGHGTSVAQMQPRAQEKAADPGEPAPANQGHPFPFMDHTMVAAQFQQQMHEGQVMSFDPAMMAQLQHRMQEQMRTFAVHQMSGGMHSNMTAAAAGAAAVLLAGGANQQQVHQQHMQHMQHMQLANGVGQHPAAPAPAPGDDKGHDTDGANGT